VAGKRDLTPRRRVRARFPASGLKPALRKCRPATEFIFRLTRAKRKRGVAEHLPDDHFGVTFDQRSTPRAEQARGGGCLTSGERRSALVLPRQERGRRADLGDRL